jgi:hypothetical protein
MSDTSLVPPAYITCTSSSPGAGFAAEVRAAFERTMVDEGKLPVEILRLPGMSGRKYRLFINNLIELMPQPRYLEVGVWQGSTLCSAIFGNEVSATAIDNWSQFNGPAARFLGNLSRFKGKAKVSFLECNFREVDFQHIGRFNVYLFDGPHTHQDQYDGVTLADAALDAAFVLIVDDWNWDRVRSGTFNAIRDKGYQIDQSFEIRTTLDNTHARIARRNSDWHNGYFIAAMRKSDG